MPSFINECAEVQKGEVSHLKSPCGSSLAQIQVLITREITKFLPLKVVIKCPLSPGLLSHNMGHSMVQGLGGIWDTRVISKENCTTARAFWLLSPSSQGYFKGIPHHVAHCFKLYIGFLFELRIQSNSSIHLWVPQYWPLPPFSFTMRPTVFVPLSQGLRTSAWNILLPRHPQAGLLSLYDSAYSPPGEPFPNLSSPWALCLPNPLHLWSHLYLFLACCSCVSLGAVMRSAWLAWTPPCFNVIKQHW